MEGSSNIPDQSSSGRYNDPAWAHAGVVPGQKNHTICLFCNKHLKGGGITRLKRHLAGVKGDVEACKKVSHDVKWQMKTLLDEHQFEKDRRERLNLEIGSGSSFPGFRGDYGDVQGGSGSGSGTGSGTGSVPSQFQDPVQSEVRKRRRQLSGFFAPRTTPGAQPSIRSAMQTRDAAHNVNMAVARWWYDTGSSFNASQSYYYQPMIDVIASYGPGYKGSSVDDLRGKLLSCAVSEMRAYLAERRVNWGINGCSIMCDGWTNRRQELIINFLVYCFNGSMFLKSIDASSMIRNADNFFRIFDEVVNEVGVENIVQFITDNDSAYKAAGIRLQRTYNSFYWTPCVAHCIDLILEDIGNPRYFPVFDETMQKAKKVTKFIYNRAWILNLMRTGFTNGRNLCRPAVTRFATNFLSLQSFLSLRVELRQMFTSDKWVTSQHARSNAGMEVCSIILEDREFWSQCQFVIRVCEPLVRVLRLADSEEKPTMGYIFDAMERATEAIKANLKHRPSLYQPYISIINERRKRQLSSPLFVAGAFLNPSVYFRLDVEKQAEVSRGMLMTITTIVPHDSMQIALTTQMEAYKYSYGDFGMSVAIQQRGLLSPVAWWDLFGCSVPDLRKFAIRILSQCVSATGCERNWSTFEFIHSKKRNRLEHKRLNDLIFVRYNLKLRERTLSSTSCSNDPIAIDNIDILVDWVSEESNLVGVSDLNVEDDLGLESIDIFNGIRLFDD
ncbi:hypothetical protein K2173_020006 [Erythroxylum novogranatense]|uniref:BED-type domain-containing protein n=1 Tax=Erythroxylum novogranatense TaxID=1862640 RepID=A0AAV8U6S2_9ROSI|nr:hypothetical protein K2173_020006 [Erythroxylum novogranatense]